MENRGVRQAKAIYREENGPVRMGQGVNENLVTAGNSEKTPKELVIRNGYSGRN